MKKNITKTNQPVTYQQVVNLFKAERKVTNLNLVNALQDQSKQLVGLIETSQLEVLKAINGFANQVEARFNKLEEGKTDLQRAQAVTNVRLAKLEDGQEQIKLRLDNVAYRFEINELNQRVTVLERKIQ